MREEIDTEKPTKEGAMMKEKVDLEYVLVTQNLLDELIRRSKKIVKSNDIKSAVAKHIKYDFKRLLRTLESM
jgi:hypothetical protein